MIRPACPTPVLLVTALTLLCAFAPRAQTRTPWEMNGGEGIVFFPVCPTPSHGHPSEYDDATIPPVGDPGWGPAPDGEIIAYSLPRSTLCGVAGCRCAGEFTYFQTFVDIPASVVVTDFRIAFSGIDDGVRVTIFNSDFPAGEVVPGSYVFLGGTGTADLSSLVRSGEVNRVVVTHVDDCCSGTRLSSARVFLNGEEVLDDVECSAGGPYEAPCAGSVALDGTVTADLGRGPVSLAWSTSCPGTFDDATIEDPVLTLSASGTCAETCAVTLTALQDGVESTCTAAVTVADSTPPQVTAGSGLAECLWSPNHWSVCFHVDDVAPEVTDDCNAVTVTIVGCLSDQPDEAPDAAFPPGDFNGDGKTVEDCVISPDGDVACVRAERAGAGALAQDGRTVSFLVVAKDACGNESGPVEVGAIRVSHDQSPVEPGCLKSPHVGLKKHDPWPWETP